MRIGALIGAYQEDESGALRALLPLAGRTVVEYQVRCAAALEAAPIVVLVTTLPPALNAAFDRLAQEGLPVIAVSDAAEAATRFEPDEWILQIGDGILPDVADLERLAGCQQSALLTVADDPAHAEHERIDAETRWAGVALVDGRAIASTAAMLGDWDLQSTLLRRTIQAGATRLPAASADGQGPLLAVARGDAERFERRLVSGSRAERRDWVARYLLPPVEDLGTEKLMETGVGPQGLLGIALLLWLGGSLAISRGWMAAAALLLVLVMPLDLIARRLASLRLRPLAAATPTLRAQAPVAGLVLVSLGWWVTRQSGQYGALIAALATLAFARALAIEVDDRPKPGFEWLFSRRSAIIVAIPFAALGAFELYLVAMLLHAAASFFVAQHVAHRPRH